MPTLIIQKFSLVALSLLLSLLMISCGGGGGDASGGDDIASEENNNTSGTPANDNTIVSEEPKVTLTMQELVADADFSFTSKQVIQVAISLAQYDKTRAYISVYSDYQQLPSGRYYPDENSRTIAGNLEMGVFENSFISFNSQSTFLVEIWFYDGQDALQKELMVNNNSLSW